MNNQKINIELMFSSMLKQTNKLIEMLDKINPHTEEYGVALSNLAKSFAILSGASMPAKGDKDGDK